MICQSPRENTSPDFTMPADFGARRRVAGMLVAGLPLPTVAALFGIGEGELTFDTRTSFNAEEMR